MESNGLPSVASSLPEPTSVVPAAEVAADERPSFLLTAVAQDSLVHSGEATAADSQGANKTGGRAFDLIVATALLILVFPVMTLCALAVLLSSPGAVLFRQARIGRGGVEFSCLKFRTMVNNADRALEEVLRQSAESVEQWEAVQKLTWDPRITPVGRFLRRYCLDELPQLFNVLAGQMSVVGPRPIVADEISRYGLNFGDYCLVRPGLTGLWQVSGRHALSYTERVRFDTEYVRSKSVRLDFLILLRTVPIVFLGENM